MAGISVSRAKLSKRNTTTQGLAARGHHFRINFDDSRFTKCPGAEA
jgi:hypothetical protein